MGGQGWIDYTVTPAVPGTFDLGGANRVPALGDRSDAGLVGRRLASLLFLLIDKTIGLRPSAEVEREGLDINEHGERAYNM